MDNTKKMIIPKSYMTLVGESMFYSIDAKYVNNITNEKGERLKYSYNLASKILNILGNPNNYESVEIEYLPKIIN